MSEVRSVEHPSAPTAPAPSVVARRSQVVERLLALGVSADTLELLLPDWGTVIAEVQPLQTGSPT